MPTSKKKPSPAQLAARKRFVEMVRSGKFKGARRKVASKKKATTKRRAAPSPAQLAARAKFVAMVRARAGKKAKTSNRVTTPERAKRLAAELKAAKNPRRHRYALVPTGSGLATSHHASRRDALAARKRAKKRGFLGLRAVKTYKKNGPIRMSEAEAKRYAPKIKGLSLVASSAPKKRKAKRFKAPAKRGLARAFSGSGFLGLGRSRKKIRANKRRRNALPPADTSPSKTPKGKGSTSTEVRSPTSTEVKSPTRTATSTEAQTSGNVTVTGGAGRGATTRVDIHTAAPKTTKATVGRKKVNPAKRTIVVVIHPPGKKRNNGLLGRMFGRKRKVAKVGYRKTQVGHRRIAPVGYRRTQRGSYRPTAVAQRKASRRRPALNPSPASVFSEFRGKNATTKTQVKAASGTPNVLAKLGGLVELHVRGKRLHFSNGASLAADGRRKLHIVGAKLARPNPPGEVDYGEILSITYRADKPHIEEGVYDYKHHFGEDGGKRPHLIVDSEGYPIIEGGSYKISSDGIID